MEPCPDDPARGIRVKRDRLIAVVAVAEALALVLAATGLLLSARSPSATTPGGSVSLWVGGVRELPRDDYDRISAAGNTFVFLLVGLENHLGAGLVVDNGSFVLDAGVSSYPGTVVPPGTAAVDDGESVNVTVEFEVPYRTATTGVRLSEGPAVARASFAYRVSWGGPYFPEAMNVTVRPSVDGSNWTVVIQYVPTGHVPTATYLLVRDAQGLIVLTRTPFSSLTTTWWNNYHAVFEDANPSWTDLRPGDALVIGRTAYPAGSTAEVSSNAGVLATVRLH